jgi:hypothetical protein
MPTDAAREARCRRRARRYDLAVRKHRDGFYVFDPFYNAIVSPENLDLDELEVWLAD